MSAGVIDVASPDVSRCVGWAALLLAAACGSRSSLLEQLRSRELDEGGAPSGGGVLVATGGAAAAGDFGLADTTEAGGSPTTRGGAAVGGAGGAGGAGNGGTVVGTCAQNPCQNGGSCLTSGEAQTCACLAAFTGDTCELPRFEGLGSLPGFQESYALAISGDGRVVVGYVPQGRPDEREAFRWTKASGMAGLGYLPSSSYGSAASATSADGAALAGDATHHNDCQGCGDTQRPIRWQASSGIEDLSFLADHYNGFATGISADGSVIVGFSYGSPSSEMHWFRWTEQAGPEDLGSGYATGISADGQTIVGAAYDGRYQAMRWTEQDGRIPLGGVDPYYDSLATAASSDGSMVVGWSLGPSGSRAFRWQKSTGAVSLGTLPGDNYSVATSMSADGAVVVGASSATSAAPAPMNRAVLWDEARGMSAIETLLEAADVDLTGWRLSHASGISMNGKVVTGWGTNPSGAVESWIARLP
jgi:uncharacterized membrane protein